MTPRVPSRTLLIVAIATASAGTASADPKAEARRHVSRASVAHAAGRYADALVELTVAYTLDPQPELLFAMGQVELKLGNCAGAVDAYQRFLATHPPADEVTVVEEAIQTCPTHHTEPPAPPPPAPMPAPTPPAPIPAVVNRSDASILEATVAVPPPRKAASRAWGTWSLVGGGAVMGVIAGVLYKLATDNRDQADSLPTYEQYANQVTLAHQEATASLVLAGAGGVLVTAGAIYHFTRPATGPSISMLPLRAGAGLALSSRF